MTVNPLSIVTLPDRLAINGYGSAHYSIGVVRKDAVSIERVGGAWIVCPKFEGHMRAMGRFGDEHRACEHVLRLLNEELYRESADGGKGNEPLQKYFARERVPVEERIRAFGVGTAHYSIGEVREGAWCLIEEDGRWLSFLVKNGKRTSRIDHRGDFAAAESAFPYQIKIWRRVQLAAGAAAEELAADR